MSKPYLNLFGLLAVLLFVAFINPVNAQFNRDRTVLLTTTINEAQHSITLNFQKFSNTTRLRVFRKEKNAADWGNAYATLGLADSTFKDTAIAVGQSYEYMVYREGATAQDFSLGSVYAGINFPAEDIHGAIAVVIDGSYVAPLATELAQLEHDLAGDGWQVFRIVVSRTDSVTTIRNKIKAVPGIKAVFLVGHVPVPYSGNIYPDGHPDHQGAWPCDGYYGDIDGIWTDNQVNNSSAARSENKNVPGDGKFDVGQFLNHVDLMTGRVDMLNLPAFTGQTDTALLRYYFQKNHNYRIGTLTAPYRALIDDNFQSYTIASSNWRNFPQLVGAKNITDNVNTGADYYTDLKKDWYIWSGACGGGSFNSCGGVINTPQFAADSIKTIFTSLAGSYFGDWNSQDNLLRAAVASKPGILASFWGGIPNWTFHHMGLGECIGYGAMTTQNEDGTLYEGNFNGSQRLVHIALMGDPTLRLFVVKPATGITVTKTGTKKVTVSWAASPDATDGYHIYRANHLYGKFVRLTETPTTATSYSDFLPLQGHNVYMVRAVKKQTTPSGSFYNYSQGMFDSTDISYPAGVYQPQKTLQLSVFPNPSHSILNIVPDGFNGVYLNGIITNVLGQTVKQFTLENNLNTLDISAYPSGIYFITITGEGYSGQAKFVKE